MSETFTTPRRVADWPERLNALLAERYARPFAFGSNDCCLFAADTVLALTGFDLGAALRGQYSTAEEAARVLQEEGGVQALATTMLGQPRELPLLAQRGDVVCVEMEGRLSLGVVVGNGQWCAPGASGLVFRPMSEVLQAWEV